MFLQCAKGFPKANLSRGEIPWYTGGTDLKSGKTLENAIILMNILPGKVRAQTSQMCWEALALSPFHHVQEDSAFPLALHLMTTERVGMTMVEQSDHLITASFNNWNSRLNCGHKWRSICSSKQLGLGGGAEKGRMIHENHHSHFT